MIYSIDVGFSPDRPIVPDAKWTRVHVQQPDSFTGAAMAMLDAAQMVHLTHNAAMVTSTKIVSWREAP